MGSKRVFTMVLAAVLSLGMLPCAAAESKSTRAVRVSVTVPALFQLTPSRSAANGLSLDVKTNLHRHSVAESLVRTPGGVRKLVTVTAR